MAEISRTSRRTFLKQASVGAAVVGAVAATPGFLGSAHAEPIGPMHDGPFVAWVKDAKSGVIAVMVGEREVLHQDRELAAQLARIAAK
jgi:hypothetical protein